MQNKNRAVTEVCIRFEPETEGQSGSTGALLPYDRRIPFDPSCFDRRKCRQQQNSVCAGFGESAAHE
jgi:hypothetical protein